MVESCDSNQNSGVILIDVLPLHEIIDEENALKTPSLRWNIMFYKKVKGLE